MFPIEKGRGKVDRANKDREYRCDGRPGVRATAQGDVHSKEAETDSLNYEARQDQAAARIKVRFHMRVAGGSRSVDLLVGGAAVHGLEIVQLQRDNLRLVCGGMGGKGHAG